MERVSKERRRQLEQYCRASLSYYPRVRYSTVILSRRLDPTLHKATAKLLIEEAAGLCDPELKCHILTAVTRGMSYAKVDEYMGVPCSRGKFYRRLEKFYYILDGLIRNNYNGYNDKNKLISMKGKGLK